MQLINSAISAEEIDEINQWKSIVITGVVLLLADTGAD